MAANDRQEILEGICDQLSAHDYKITRQRRVIIGTLLDNTGRHLSAEEIYDLVRTEHPEIGVATVYRTLDILAGLDIVKRLDFGDGRGVYELGDDLHHHHHLICLSCGQVSEFAGDLLEPLEQEIARREGFDIVDHHVKFFGICARCSKAAGG